MDCAVDRALCPFGHGSVSKNWASHQARSVLGMRHDGEVSNAGRFDQCAVRPPRPVGVLARRECQDDAESITGGLPAVFVTGHSELHHHPLPSRIGSAILAVRRSAGNVAASALVRRVPQYQLQRTLNANGDRAGFTSLTNGILAVQVEVVVGSGGQVTLRNTDVQGPPTPTAQELASVLHAVIGDRHATTINFTRGSGRVVVGSYELSTLDLDDIEALGGPSGRGLNAGTAMAHEIVEQYRKQVHREAYPVAHAAGLASEARAAGATITPGPMRQVNASTVEIQDIYEYPDRTRQEVTITLVRNNVTNVRRRDLP